MYKFNFAPVSGAVVTWTPTLLNMIRETDPAGVRCRASKRWMKGAGARTLQRIHPRIQSTFTWDVNSPESRSAGQYATASKRTQTPTPNMVTFQVHTMYVYACTCMQLYCIWYPGTDNVVHFVQAKDSTEHDCTDRQFKYFYWSTEPVHSWHMDRHDEEQNFKLSGVFLKQYSYIRRSELTFRFNP